MATNGGLSRRSFLALLGGGILSGCMVEPRSKLWGLWRWAEGLNTSLLRAGPLKRALVKEYPHSAISRDFPIRSLTLRGDYASTVAQWELVVDGLVALPQRYTLAQFRQAFPLIRQTTRHDCVEGWSAIAEWGGARLADLVSAVRPLPTARYVIFHSADADDHGVAYYGSLDLDETAHPQTILAYEFNGEPLPIDHGAPLRLKVPTQLGYKSTKFIHRIEFVESFAHIGGGQGGYWEDTGYERYAYI